MDIDDWKGVVKIIRKDIDDIQQASKEAQAKIIAERAKSNENHARYAVGDFVIRKKTSPVHFDKLSPTFYGPLALRSYISLQKRCDL